MNDLTKFIRDMVAEKRMTDGLDTDVAEQVINDLTEQAEAKINAEILNNLSESQQKQFETLLDRDASPEEVQQFISNSILNLDTVVGNALIEFSKLY